VTFSVCIDKESAEEFDRAARETGRTRNALSSVPLRPCDGAAARETAGLRAVIGTPSAPVGAYDALIAGTALGLTRVESSAGEYQRVERLVIENRRIS